MISRLASECKKSYNFEPISKWSTHFPIYSWGDELLCGFNLESENESLLALDLKSYSNSFSHVFQFIYPHLTVAELARFYQLVAHKNLIDSWDSFFSFYHLRNSDNLRITLSSLVQTPLEFQRWCSEKQVQVREISVLRCTSDLSQLSEILKIFTKLNPSRGLGGQILELLVELFEMKTSQYELLNALSRDSSSCLEKLISLRHPHANLQQQNKKNQQNQYLKINGIEVQWKRYGDSSGIEFKFFTESKDEFYQRLNSLHKWHESSMDNLWT